MAHHSMLYKPGDTLAEFAVMLSAICQSTPRFPLENNWLFMEDKGMDCTWWEERRSSPRMAWPWTISKVNLN